MFVKKFLSDEWSLCYPLILGIQCQEKLNLVIPIITMSDVIMLEMSVYSTKK